MKRCPRCDRWLPATAFSPNRARRDGLQNNCRACQRAYVREHYEANRDYYLAKARRSNNRRYTTFRTMLRTLKDIPCGDCGRRYPPWVMDFDHVRGQKLFNVGNGVRVYTSKLLAEADKCEVVCSNCHRERTWQRRWSQIVAQADAQLPSDPQTELLWER